MSHYDVTVSIGRCDLIPGHDPRVLAAQMVRYIRFGIKSDYVVINN